MHKRSASAQAIGGSGSATGNTYEHDIASWLAIRVLAGRKATPLWDLPPRTDFRRIYCQVNQFVDDLLVVTSDDGNIFIQAKYRIQLSRKPNKDLAKTIFQFVRQYTACKARLPEARPRRPLEPARDRLVLLTTSNSSRELTHRLPRILRRLRDEGTSKNISSITKSQSDRNLIELILQLTENALSDSTEHTQEPTFFELTEILRLCWISVADFENDGATKLLAKDTLRRLLKNPQQSDDAWAHLRVHFSDAAGTGFGASRDYLENLLTKHRIELNHTSSKVPKNPHHEEIREARKHPRKTHRRTATAPEILEDIKAAHNRRLRIQLYLDDSVKEPDSTQPTAFHFLLLLIAKYTPLLSPIAPSRHEKLLTKAAETYTMEGISVPRINWAQVEIGPPADTFCVASCIKEPSFLQEAPFQSLLTSPHKDRDSVHFKRCQTEYLLYILARYYAELQNKLREFEASLLKLTPAARQEIRRLEAYYFFEVEYPNTTPPTRASQTVSLPITTITPRPSSQRYTLISNKHKILKPALMALERQDPDALRDMLTEIRNRSTEDRTLHRDITTLQAGRLLLLDRTADAIETLQSSFETTEDSMIGLNLALLQLERGSFRAARETCKRLKKVSTDPSAELLDSVMNLQLEQAVLSAKTNSVYQNLVRPLFHRTAVSPDFEAVLRSRLATMFLKFDLPLDALATLRPASELTPFAADLLLQRGIAQLTVCAYSLRNYWRTNTPLYTLRDVEYALSSLETARRLDKIQHSTRRIGLIDHSTAVARYYQGLISRNKTRKQYFKRAAISFENLARETPETDAFWSAAAEAWLHADEPAKATTAITEIDRDRRTHVAQSNLVCSLLMSGDIALAELEIHRALDGSNTSLHLIMSIGILLIASTEYEAALSALSYLPDHSTGSWKIDCLRALAFSKLSRHHEAELALRTSLEKNSHNIDSYKAYLKSFENGTLVTLLKTTDQIRKLLRRVGYDKHPIYDVPQKIDEFTQSYSNMISTYGEIQPSPDNNLPLLFEGLVSESDELRRLSVILAEHLDQERANTKGFLAQLAELFKTTVASGSEIKKPHHQKTPPLADERFWTSCHNKIPEPSVADSIVIDVDPSSATVLARTDAGHQDGLLLQQLSILARKIDAKGAHGNLRAFEHVTEIQRKAYQEEAVRRIVMRLYGRALLCDEVGLGKTIEAGLVLAEYALRGLVRSCLILVPSHSLVDQWLHELNTKFAPALNTAKLRTGVYRRSWRNTHDTDVLIITYAAAVSKRNLLIERNWDMAIADEAHHLKNTTSKRHRLIGSLNTRYLLLLTATPLQNRVEDIFALSRLVRPTLFGNLRDFRKLHCLPKQPQFLKNPRDLVWKLSQIMVRNTVRGVVGDVRFGERIFFDITATLKDEEKVFYQSIESLFLSRSNTKSQTSLPMAYTALRTACSSPRATLGTLRSLRGRIDQGSIEHLIENAKDLKPAAKLGELRQVLESLKDEKVIVFTEFRETARVISGELDDIAITSLGPRARNYSVVENFRRLNGPQVLIATPKMSEGVNLQFCRNVINFDLPWNPFKLEQRIGRVHRVGQKAREVRVYSISAEDTLEETIRETLIKKLELFQQLVGRLSISFIEFGAGGSFKTQLINLLSKVSSRSEAAKELTRLFEGELKPMFMKETGVDARASISIPGMALVDQALSEVLDETS